MELKEKFYTWLNKTRPNTSLRPLQKVVVYAYFMISEQKERTEVLDLIDEYEDATDQDV